MSTDHPLTELSLLLEEAQDISDNPQNYTPEEIAGAALALARVFSDVSSAIEPLKVILRKEARTLLVQEVKTTGKVRIPGITSLGSSMEEGVTVTFATQVKLSKGFDPDALKEHLGGEFSRFFETRVTYAPVKDFRDELNSLSGNPGRSWVLKLLTPAVEQVELTPRVGFPSFREE